MECREMSRRTRRLIAVFLVTLLPQISAPTIALAQQPASQSQAPSQTAPASQPVEPAVPGQPTMPPINRNELPDNPNPAPSSPETAVQAPSQPPPTAQPAPTGTAAAQAERPSGNAASRPAGAAIAPPKQRQVRSFLIKMGFIAGAGVALGTVYALSTASPSRVPNAPGAH